MAAAAADMIPKFNTKELTKTSFWLQEYKMHDYLKPIHGTSPTKADITLTWGIGVLFMLLPLAFYGSDALPAEGWQRGLFCLVNLYLAAGAITFWTEDTKAYWANQSKRVNQGFLVLNGIALALIIVTMPGAMLPCISAYVFSTATGLLTDMCPKKLIQPISMAGATVSMGITMGLGATSAAAPTCIMYIIFICLAVSSTPPGMMSAMPQM